MKKLFAILLTVSLIFAFCSCKKSNDDISSGGSYSEPTYTSELTEIESKNASSSDTTSSNTPSEPNETVITDPIVNNSSKEEPKDTSSVDEPPKEEPQKPINFVPTKLKVWNSELKVWDSEETFIPYSNRVFYKGVEYAACSGKNNDVDCCAIVTVGNDDEYLKCISIFDAANNERALFNICNDRIYYIQHEINDLAVVGNVILLNSFYVYSMNLSGKDKRIEKKIDVPFTSIDSVTHYIDSKYLIFRITNTYNKVNPYDVIYRYNTQTKELVNLNQRLGNKTVLSIQEKVFVYSDVDKAFFEYDINFNNKKLLFDMTKYGFTGFAVNGFVIREYSTNTYYILDFSGNLSKKE